MINFTWRQFSELSNIELYTLLSLRSKVFVVEQHCFYHDQDGKDLNALHLMGMEDGQLVAYLRLFLPTETEKHIVFGRVLTATPVRSKGYGKKLIQELIGYCDMYYPNRTIKCSAQHYLTKFYESFGFVAYGDVYDDAGIPHISMSRDV